MFYYNLIKCVISFALLSLNKNDQVFCSQIDNVENNSPILERADVNLVQKVEFKPKFDDENQTEHVSNDGVDDDDDLYIDLEISSNIFAHLEKIINETQHATTVTNVSLIKNLKNFFNKPNSNLDESMIQAGNGEYFKLLQIGSKVFREYKYYLFALGILVAFLIAFTVVLMLVNFMLGKRYSNSYTCNNAKFKKNISFDFIDNGYLTNRGLKLKSLTRSPKKLVVDKDYHFENFTRRNSIRSFERGIKSDTFENIYELPCTEAIEYVNDKKRQQQNLAKAVSEHSLKFKTFSTRRYESLKVIPTKSSHASNAATSLLANKASEEQFDSGESNEEEEWPRDYTRHSATLQPNVRGLKFKFYSKYDPTMISFCHEAYKQNSNSKCLASSQIDRLKVVRV
jgi:hypothetical protein